MSDICPEVVWGTYVTSALVGNVMGGAYGNMLRPLGKKWRSHLDRCHNCAGRLPNSLHI